MPMEPLPDLTTLSLADIARLAQQNKLPPVERWNPVHCGHSGMRIARDGTWFHDGSPIGRINMIRLFSTVLRREADGSHVLVTPVEKLDIDVDDAPFVATSLKAAGSGPDSTLVFQLNTGDLVTAGEDHRLRFVSGADGPRPYLHVRGGMEALIARPVYYELADIALAGGDDPVGVWSNGSFFALEPAA